MKIEEATDRIADLLSRHGVRHAVVSSGSRSLRMVRAVADNGNIAVRMIVDERVAAFSALGISDCTGEPVALVCTSGSAMLNYAPAIAEACYRGVPLIVITADRPRDLIDINDGQTIHQYNALANIVKESIDIDATTPCSSDEMDSINSIIATALSPRKGPVHINLHLEEGNDKLTFAAPEYDAAAIAPSALPSGRQLEAIDFSSLSGRRILIFAGTTSYDDETRECLRHLSERPDIVVVADIVSNCNGGNIITDIESIMGKVRENSATFTPDLLITLGKTSPISRAFKEWLRSIGSLSHWRVNDTAAPEDTYYHLDKTVVVDDKCFLKHLSTNLPTPVGEPYNAPWIEIYAKAQRIKRQLLSEAPWSDVSAIDTIVHHTPDRFGIHSSNGMTIRYLSLTGVGNHAAYCNRGVNGIDGSTSTALGFSTVSERPTLLISGDMSALYDISALFSGQLSPRFKMIVIDNSGGEIFRLTKATRDYEDCEQMLCRMPAVNWKDVAASVGMAFFNADSYESLTRNIDPFFNESIRASLMVITIGAGNSITYRNIIKEIYKQL